MPEQPRDLVDAPAPEPKPTTAVGEEVHRQRVALGLSLRAAARRTGVPYSVICEVERGTRVPSIPTYAKLRSGLALDAPATILIAPRVAAGLTDDHLTALAACVVLQRGGTLAALAEALHIPIAAVREGLLAVADRLAAVGLWAAEDGDEVAVGPLPVATHAAAAVATVEDLRPLTAEQVEVLAVVAHLGTATRRQVDRYRGDDSETVLRRLCARGLLDKERDEAEPHAPALYRLTALALAATGHPTLASLQAFLAGALPSSRSAAAADRALASAG